MISIYEIIIIPLKSVYEIMAIPLVLSGLEGEGKSKEQYSDAVPCHVLSCVLVDVHVREMSRVRCAHFDHRRGGVQ